MLTGVLLAVARISGETAPLLFTALSNSSFTADMSSPMATLPVIIYNYAASPYPDWKNLALGRGLAHYVFGADLERRRSQLCSTQQELNR